MTIKQAIQKWLDTDGADGLCNAEGCYCTTSNPCKCGCAPNNCVSTKRVLRCGSYVMIPLDDELYMIPLDDELYSE